MCWTRLTGVCAVALLLATAVTPSPCVATPPPSGSASPANTHIRSPQTFFAHLSPGEQLDASFIKATDSTGAALRDVTVTVRRPGGFPASCQVLDDAPVGAACTLPGLTSPAAGIWSVEFAMSDCPSTGQCSGDRFSWSIAVRSGATGLPGRVWTEKYLMNQNATAQPVDLSFWYQSEFGYTYQGIYRQYNGIDSTIAADNFGVVRAGTCTPAYESSATLQPAEGACGGVFKVFFEPPSDDLPAAATRWDSSTDWVKPPIAPDPTISDATFTPAAPGSRAGTLTFGLADYSGAFVVRVDVDNDGDTGDPVDRTLPVTAAEGPVSVSFDGIDGTGTPIAANRSISFRIVVDRVAEIHFINSDVELRGGGIDVTRLNGTPIGKRTLHWNDTTFPHPDPNRCSETPVTDGRAGVPSTGGVHGWDLGSCGSVGGANSNNGVNGAWGDVRYIDDWAYVPVMVAQSVPVLGHDLRIAKTASRPTAHPGDVVTYTVTVENTGDFAHTAADPAEVTDDLSDVLDDATMTGPPTATAGIASVTASTLHWAGPLAPGEKATITYSARVNQPDTGDKKLVNSVVSTTPGASCVTGATDPACATVVHVPALKIVKEADRTEYKPGDVVRFTVTVTNSGEVPFTASDPASFTDDLTGVLDDAVFTVDDVVVSSGVADFTSPVLSWSGELAAGQSATVTYVVTATDPDTGDGALRNVVTGSPGAAINCVVCEVGLESRVVSLSKNVVSRTPNADGSFTLVYDLAVTGGGSEPSTYDLADELRFGAGVTVHATSAVDLSGETVNVGWDGRDHTSVVTGVSIAPGETDTYRLTVNASPGPATTGAATDCATDDGETGTGFRNTAAVTGSGGTETAQACSPIPRLSLTKTVLPGSPKHNGDGTYTVEYRIDVVNSGATSVTYDLADALSFGSGLSAGVVSVANIAPGTVPVSPGWDGRGSTSVASGVDIEPGDTHTYVATAVTSVDPAAAGGATDCVVADGESGTGFLGTATVTGDGHSQHADACVEAPNLAVTKQAVGGPAPGGEGTFTQIYDVTVANRGAGATTYDLTDQLRFGAGIDVRTTGVVNTSPGTLPTSSSWDGASDVVVVKAIPVSGSTSHVYRVTVVVEPDPSVTGTRADCIADPGETGTGLRNIATATQNGRSLAVEACTALPVISVGKKVTGFVPNGDSTYTTTYEVTVTNDGAGEGRYDLADSLEYGADVQIVAASATLPPAAGTGAGWDGSTDPFVASDVSIEANSSHVYVVTVTASPPDDPAAGALDCALDSGESGTGARNRAIVLSNGVSRAATACVAFPHLSISKVVLPGSPKPNGDGTHTVVYEIDVRNSGAQATAYDLTDELLPGKGISVVSAVAAGPVATNQAWNGTAGQEIVSGVGIAADVTHTYQLTVVYVVDPTTAATAATDCMLDKGETGTGFLGRAVATSNGSARTAEACAEAALLSVTQEMAAPVTPNGDGTHTAMYEITVTNTGAGAAVYSLTDHLRFGSGIRTDEVAASAVGDGPAPDSGWRGTDDGRFVTDVTIAGGGSHVYRVTTTVRSLATGKATDCVVDPGESGTGLRNLVTMNSNGVTEEAAACDGLPAVALTKDVVRATPRGDGRYAITYRITVTNDGAAGTSYSLHDSLRFGTGTTIESATAEGVSGWDGRLVPVVGEDIPLAAGEEHTYTVEVVATPPASARAEAFDCALGQDEEGTGALNTAAMVVNGVSTSANACAPFPGVTLTKVVLPGSPRVEPGGDVVVDYRITVVNKGAADTTYDLDDQLRLGAGTEVTGATVMMSPDVAPTNPGWNGRTDLRVANGVRLAAGAGHTYVVTVHAEPGASARAGCAPAAGEQGGGLRNTATVIVNGTSLTTDACAPVPDDSLAATGLDIEWLAGMGAVLLIAGVALVLATRRRSR